MLIVLEKLRNIESKLLELKEKKKIVDFRLILKLNMSANLYIVTDLLSDVEIRTMIDVEKIDIDIEKISEREFENDDYYLKLFNKTRTFDLGLRRSLSNIIEYDDDIEGFSSCPIVSFYSYKGGVGRTTALALFASYYAMHYNKKVFIIDCDFEAPGLINFYGLSNEEIPKNGIVEYIKDKEALIDIALRDNYTYEISRKYTGDGEINLLAAGNIFDDMNRFDYLEALARLDIHSTSTIVEQFKNVIYDINKEFSPDVILIDSRTGFNDIFGIIANKLSNIIVGFFGNNSQNKPGLHFFLNTLLKKKREIDMILVLSIVSTSFMKELRSFQNEIEDYIESNVIGESIPALPCYSLSRYPSLEKIGTEEEDSEDFITIVERKMLNDYCDLFNHIEQSLSKENKYLCKKRELITEQEKNQKDKALSSEKDLKKIILKSLSQKFPEPYADNIDFTDDFLNTEFYIRKCMEDIFNQDKFILLGSKGTGKTAFYQALRHKDFFNTLCIKAQKHHMNYEVINIISLESDDPVERIKYMDVIANFPPSEINDPEFFYKRFWQVYIWNAIRLDDRKIGFSSNFTPVEPIYNNNATAKNFHKYIFENDSFQKIEDELYQIDNYLKTKDKYLIIVFDQLDKVVKPNSWSQAISPLIRLSRTHNYKRIYPKLFLRRDLFNKLGNLTNKESLENQAINLEWSQEELYAFFFKVIFARCEDVFFNYAKNINSIPEKVLKSIEQKLHRKNSYNQLSSEIYLLKPLVITFFGKDAGRYGETYDWIYKNLKNADGTISLRPFLDLIKYAIEKQYELPYLNEGEFPILSYKCINAEVRAKAVERHFNDLSGEEGNEILKDVISDIREDKVPKELKISPLLQKEFESLITNIISRHDRLKERSILELEEILKLNGIMFIRYLPGGSKKYTFAYLYKYYLGLRSPMKRKY